MRRKKEKDWALMPNSDVGGGGGAEPGSNSGPSNPGSKVVVDPLRLGEKGGVGGLPTLSIVISQPEEAPSPKGDVAKGGGAVEGDEKVVGGASAAAAAAAKKGCLPRSESYHEQCRYIHVIDHLNCFDPFNCLIVYCWFNG